MGFCRKMLFTLIVTHVLVNKDQTAVENSNFGSSVA